MKPKLICLDIDGTITSDKFSIPKQNKKAIQQIINNGIRILFATGRSYSYSEPIFNQFSGNFFSSLQNGTSLYSEPDGNALKDTCLPLEIALKLAQWLTNQGQRNIMLVTGREDGDKTYYIEGMDYNEYFYKIISSYPERRNGLNDFAAIKNDLNIRVVGAVDKTSNIRLLINSAVKEFPDLAVMSIYDPFNPAYSWLNILPKGASKGQMLQHLAEKLGFSHKEIAAAGNDTNDIEMLDYAGNSAVVRGEINIKGKNYTEIASPEEGGISDWLLSFI
ncbi:MAG: HAD family phosphatase [Spirochaetes bacterium]|nr:HAD family phosphatase [Spirochaetota bacterium]